MLLATQCTLAALTQSSEASDIGVDFGLVSQKSATTVKTLKRFPVTSNISQDKDADQD